MEKHYTLLFIAISIISLGFSQNENQSILTSPEVISNSSHIQSQQATFPSKIKPHNSKALGDTIYYQDFNGGMPSGWVTLSNSANNFVWTWDTLYRNGQFTLPSNIITSSTVANGFLSLPSDFYNTPTPITGPVTMNTFIQSSNIDLTNNGTSPNGVNSVLLTLQQTMNYCCNPFPNGRLFVQVSNDNFITFREYDLTLNTSVNTIRNTTTDTINISSIAGNETDIKLRFYGEGFSHFFWMIDDIAIIEGPDFEMSLSNASPEFNNTFPLNPFYSQIPIDLFSPLIFSGTVTNTGGIMAMNARLEVSIFNDSMTRPFPGPGLGLQYINTQLSSPTNLAPLVSSPIIVGGSTPFFPIVLGDYTAILSANSDSTNLTSFNQSDSFSFSISDTVMALDDGSYEGLSLSPSNFVRNGMPGGTSPNDKLGAKFIVEPNLNARSQAINPIPTSISFLVSNDTSNIGVGIMPKIWDFSTSPVSEVASSSAQYIVQSADLGQWISLTLDSGTAVTAGLITPREYYVGWETISIIGSTSFSVQQDQSSGNKQPSLTTLIDFGHSPGWGSIPPTNPAIRLNFGQLPIITGITNTNISKTEFSITPNPSDGILKLEIPANTNTIYYLNVINTLGQAVYNETIHINGKLEKQLDLRTFEKGIYFVSLKNEAEKVAKKVIIK